MSKITREQKRARRESEREVRAIIENIEGRNMGCGDAVSFRQLWRELTPRQRVKIVGMTALWFLAFCGVSALFRHHDIAGGIAMHVFIFGSIGVAIYLHRTKD